MNTFCVLPWIHLATHPHGGTSLCCVTDFKDGAGMSKDGENYYNLNKNTITEHMNSEVFKNTRLSMLKDEIPSPCKRCYTEEKKGITSKRAIENKNYSNFTIGDAKKITNIDGSIDPKLEFVELRLGNVCNVKCVTCNPASSSKWASDYKILIYGARSSTYLRHLPSQQNQMELSNAYLPIICTIHKNHT